MKAWLIYDFNKMKLGDIEIPKIRPGWVLIKVKVVQPSITEVMLYKGVNLSHLKLIKQRIKNEAPVQLFGHEFCGEVINIGNGVNRIKVRDMVAGHSVAPCRECFLCKTGMSELCNNQITLGFTIPGAFAEYILVPEELLVRVPSNISAGEAACIQPLSECISEVYHSGIKPGDKVVIIGQGVMGLFTLSILKYAGAGKIFSIDIRDESLEISRKFGSDYIINSRNIDPVKNILELTDGIGVDIVFECSGLGDNISKALKIVRRNGKIVILSLISDETLLSLSDFRLKCVDIVFPPLTTFRMLEHSVFLLSKGLIDIKPLITHQLEGIDKVPDAFKITGNKIKYKAINSAQVILY